MHKRDKYTQPALPITLEVTEGTDKASAAQKRYEHTLEQLKNVSSSEALISNLVILISNRNEIGWSGHRNLSMKRLRRILKFTRNHSLEESKYLLELVFTYLSTQKDILHRNYNSVTEFRHLVSLLDKKDHAISNKIDPYYTIVTKNRTRSMKSAFMHGLERILYYVGNSCVRFGRTLLTINSNIPMQKIFRIYGWFLVNFMSYESLRRTGLEASIGLRFYVKGTRGFVGNTGPWLMLYSGSLYDYQSKAVPMRVNPGATISTPFYVITLNRPGLGAGASLPIGSTYIDGARYKLLIGIDGWGYIRTGDWEGRGPYVTISASIPISPICAITWNASIFNPGFAYLTNKLTPFSRRLRSWTDKTWYYISAPFRVIKNFIKQ